MGHHIGRAKIALDETVQFDLAIEAAVAMTNRSDTLIIVTADHAHTMTINGYPPRGNDIFGNSFNDRIRFSSLLKISSISSYSNKSMSRTFVAESITHFLWQQSPSID